MTFLHFFKFIGITKGKNEKRHDASFEIREIIFVRLLGYNYYRHP